MSILVSLFISDFINNLVLTLVFKKINNLNKKLNFKDMLLIITISALTSLIIMSLPSSVRFIIKTFIMLFAYKYIFKQNFSKTTISIFILYILLTISEIIFSIIFPVLLGIDQNFLQNNWLGIIIANIVILSIAYGISCINKVRDLSVYIIKWYNNNDKINNIIMCLLGEATIVILLYQNFENIVSIKYFIICNIFLAGVMLFMIGYFKQKTDNTKLISDYDLLLEYSKIYEKEVNEKSKQHHEYKNQLAIVKGMANPKNKKLIEYIDNILDTNEESTELRVVNKLSYILTNGLKGLIYYKIKEMKAKKINIFVDVSEQLNSQKLWRICDNNIKDVSRCLGVYLDNAIEATNSLTKKQISIEVTLEENNIIFIISNNYNGKLEVNNFDIEGYSSKGKNRGYGLTLVKEIIDKNKNLSQSREINGNYYVQKLYIKTKKL